MGATPTLIDSREAAALLACSVRTIRRAARDGSLPAIRLRERSPLRFRRVDLEQLLGADPGRRMSGVGGAEETR